VGLLRPTLEAADQLLDRTPAFLDEATAVVPQVQTATERLAPAVAFLRPYTPEIMGFASNWGNVWSTYDSQGHFAHPLVVTGKTAVDNNPNVTLPGEFSGTVRLPGESVGQPWTDANGSAPR
jgi:phospholipid/cholesterol/gamma-HCH transport system substrate-binding protein